MATLNLNDLKVRILQLKGIGYDKLRRRDEINVELTQLSSDLEAIDSEVTGLMSTLEEATAQMAQQQTPPQGTQQTPPAEDQTTETETTDNGAAVEGNLSGTHVVVDQNALSAALSPTSKAAGNKKGKTKSNKRSDKTSHTIGRRS